MLRLPKDDVRKSPAIIKRQLKYNLICCVDGCGEPISQMTGPGSDKLCRGHQIQQIGYEGGVGRYDRPHTFHRSWVCIECGKDVSLEVLKKFPGINEQDPALFNRLCRNRVIADHKIRRVDGGDDSSENVQNLCLDCNSDKTILNEDYKRNSS
jgi:5-methylcytosine-specific restriction endonuclease McrA